MTLAALIASAVPSLASGERADPEWYISSDALPGDPPEPSHRGYAALKDAYERYRAIAARGGWGSVSAGPELRVGVSDPRVRQLRNRLRVSGDFSGEVQADPHFFDSRLHEAVQRFQQRHRLRASGAVDARTLAALNVSAESRVLKIAVALWSAGGGCRGDLA